MAGQADSVIHYSKPHTLEEQVFHIEEGLPILLQCRGSGMCTYPFPEWLTVCGVLQTTIQLENFKIEQDGSLPVQLEGTTHIGIQNQHSS